MTPYNGYRAEMHDNQKLNFFYLPVDCASERGQHVFACVWHREPQFSWCWRAVFLGRDASLL